MESTEKKISLSGSSISEDFLVISNWISVGVQMLLVGQNYWYEAMHQIVYIILLFRLI